MQQFRIVRKDIEEMLLRVSTVRLKYGHAERHWRKIASSAQRMIETANELRNRAGTGHVRVVGEEPVVTGADASLVESAGLILAA